MNAEIRREKAKLKAQIPDLIKMSKKKARKLPEEKKKERADKIEAIERDLDAVPDGTAPERRKRRDRLVEQAGPITINVDVGSMALNPQSMEHSAESTAFRSEYLASKAKQDTGLDQISKGLRTLKDMGHAMSDELKKQDPLLDNIDTKATDATAELRTANTKLKALLLEMRQPHKLCLDLILVSVLLGIGSYIFTMVKPSTTNSLKETAAKVTGRRLLEALAWGGGGGGGDAQGWPGGGGLNDPAVLKLLQ
jgi:SYP7 family syntaxin